MSCHMSQMLEVNRTACLFSQAQHTNCEEVFPFTSVKVIEIIRDSSSQSNVHYKSNQPRQSAAVAKAPPPQNAPADPNKSHKCPAM